MQYLDWTGKHLIIITLVLLSLKFCIYIVKLFKDNFRLYKVKKVIRGEPKSEPVNLYSKRNINDLNSSKNLPKELFLGKSFKDNNLDSLLEEADTISLEEFMSLRKVKSHINPYSYKINEIDEEGVYVLMNMKTFKLYVGRSIRVYNRIFEHFKGSGCNEVYLDYVKGYPFEIKILLMSEINNFKDSFELERVLIDYLDTVNNGYNKINGVNKGLK